MNEMQLLIFCQADSPHMWLKEFTFHSLKKTINKGPSESVILILVLNRAIIRLNKFQKN